MQRWRAHKGLPDRVFAFGARATLLTDEEDSVFQSLGYQFTRDFPSKLADAHHASVVET